MKINKRDPRHWLLLMRQGIFTLLAIGARYLSPAPKKPVMLLYGHQLSGNLKALYDEWQRSHSEAIDCYFLSLDPEYAQVLRTDGVNVLRCGSLPDMLLVGRSNAMVTDHGLHAMSLLITFTNIVFIDVWHGIPFKGFIPEDFRVQQRYDEVWVSSPLLKTVYETKFGFSSDIVKPLGYARVDKLFLDLPPDTSLRQHFSIPPESPVVLYAPTWQQDDAGRELFPFNESQESFLEALSATCEKYSATLVIRSHLNARISQKKFDNVFYCPMKEFPCTEDLLLETDILICDWSSISFDFLALHRPTIFLEVTPPFKNGFSLGKNYRFGKVALSLESVRNYLAKALDSPQAYLSEQDDLYRNICSAVYGDNTDGEVAKRQLTHLKSLVT